MVWSERLRESDRDIERERDREIEREGERDGETEREREIYIERDRGRERKGDNKTAQAAQGYLHPELFIDH